MLSAGKTRSLRYSLGLCHGPKVLLPGWHLGDLHPGRNYRPRKEYLKYHNNEGVQVLSGEPGIGPTRPGPFPAGSPMRGTGMLQERLPIRRKGVLREGVPIRGRGMLVGDNLVSRHVGSLLARVLALETRSDDDIIPLGPVSRCGEALDMGR